MTAPVPAVPPDAVGSGAVPDDAQVHRLVRRSWLMAGLFFVAIAVSGMLGFAATSWLGLQDGQLLVAAGAAGWLVAAGLLAVQVAPVAVGAVLGARALQRGGGAAAAAAFCVNVLLGVYALVVELFQLVLH